MQYIMFKCLQKSYYSELNDSQVLQIILTNIRLTFNSRLYKMNSIPPKEQNRKKWIVTNHKHRKNNGDKTQISETNKKTMKNQQRLYKTGYSYTRIYQSSGLWPSCTDQTGRLFQIRFKEHIRSVCNNKWCKICTAYSQQLTQMVKWKNLR